MALRTADPELYKDKIEVSLDGRQIFYLFFGGAVVACMVFVLGVMVGRRLEARGHVDRAAATSATRDPLAALDQLAAGRGDLTFPQTLSSPRGAAAEVDRAIAAMGDKGKGDKAAADKGDKAATDKADKAAADKADKAAADKADKAAADKAASDKAAAAARPVDRPDTAGKGKFTLQLSAFQDKGEAEAFLGQVKGAGYGAYVVAADVDGVMYYRVRLGTYGSYEDAVAAKAEFEKKVPKIAYVTRL